MIVTVLSILVGVLVLLLAGVGVLVREMRRDLRNERAHVRVLSRSIEDEKRSHQWSRDALKTAGTASAILVRSGERVEVCVDNADEAGKSRRDTIRRAKDRARERADMRTGHYGDDNGEAVPEATANQPRGSLHVLKHCAINGCILSAGHSASHMNEIGLTFTVHEPPAIRIDETGPVSIESGEESLT